MTQEQEVVDWHVLQRLCHRRLLTLHLRERDSLNTLRSLRWAVALLQRFDASLTFAHAVPEVKRRSQPSATSLEHTATMGGLKRKAVPEDLSVPSPSSIKRARQHAQVCLAVGEAGSRTAERIEARLSLPHIFVLTKFVSHCLLISLDQQPITLEADDETFSVENDLFSADYPDGAVELDFGVDEVGALDTQNDAGDSEKRMWLYKWLVKMLLWIPPNDRSDKDLHVAALDWLVSYLTVADPIGVIRVVLEDLASELMESENKGSPILAVYLRRISIFEFVALRWEEALQ